MKLLFTLLLALPIYCLAQSDSSLPRMENDTLITTSGFKITKHQKLRIGTGSTPDGDFKFIRRNAASLFAYHSSYGYQGLANEANALPRTSSGHEYEVIRIDKRGTKKSGFVYYPILELGIRYEVDIDNAIRSGEIVVPEQYQPKKPGGAVVVKQELSVADEIAKLKKLMDDGVLTKEEFEAQKKKLLDKQ